MTANTNHSSTPNLRIAHRITSLGTLSHRVIDRWNALDGETVSASSINVFKNRLNKIRMTKMGYFMD